MDISDRISGLPVAESVKAYLIGEDSLQKKHSFYLKLPAYYAPAFSFSSQENFESLAFASYLYFRSLLLIDSAIDAKENKSNELPLVMSIFEEAMKELSWVFPRESAFWKKFYASKAEYYQIIVLEKMLNAKKSIIDKDIFRQLAIGKSAVCYAILDALDDISDSKIDVEPLRKSLQHIHMAFQCLDDIDDFKRDAAAGQITFAHSQVDQQLKDNGIEPVSVDPDLKHRYFFSAGIAGELVMDAITNYEAALTLAKAHGLELLCSFLNEELRKCKNQKKEIDLLIQKTRVKASKSISVKENKNRSLDKAISEGALYLERSLAKDDLFEDFMTTAGHGKAWVSAYAGLHLADVSEAKDLCVALKTALASRAGAFNETMGEDADSLSFLIGFLHSGEPLTDNKRVMRWLDFMSADGGWRTYSNPDRLRERLHLEESISLNGWVSPVPCVTAASCFILSFFPELRNSFNQTSAYLIKHIEPEGYWKSYWWTSPVYATSFALLGLSSTLQFSEPCKRASDWLKSKQMAGGAWLNDPTNDESVYYTSLATMALMKVDFVKHREQIDKSIAWLMENQTEDGSWKSDRILQIPATDVTNPAIVKKWRKSSFGVNVTVDDHNRVFTSSTVLNTLNLFRKYTSHAI